MQRGNQLQNTALQSATEYCPATMTCNITTKHWTCIKHNRTLYFLFDMLYCLVKKQPEL